MIWQALLAKRVDDAWAAMAEAAARFSDDRATQKRLAFFRHFREAGGDDITLATSMKFKKKVDWSKNPKLRPVHRQLAQSLEAGQALGIALHALTEHRFESLYFVAVLVNKQIAEFGRQANEADRPLTVDPPEEQPNPKGVIGDSKEKSMSKIQEICQNIVNNVDDAVAVGVVDVETGMMMGVHHTVPYFTQTYLDAVAAAAVELFRGKMVRRVEELLGKHRGKEVRDSFQEIFIKSTEVFHFMATIPGKNSVIVLVTRKTTSQGMGWASLRSAVGDISAALP